MAARCGVLPLGFQSGMVAIIALSDPPCLGYFAEAYIFAALIYFFCCFAMSNYSRRLERELDIGR